MFNIKLKTLNLSCIKYRFNNNAFMNKKLASVIKSKNKRGLWSVMIGFTLVIGAGASQAATLTTAGAVTDNNEFLSWRSNGVSKTLDADNNDSYGTAGFAWWVTGGYNSGGTVPGDPFNATGYTTASTKTYAQTGISFSNISMDKSFFGFGYPSFDDPTQPVSSNVSDALSGVAGFQEGTTTGVYHDAFSITIGSGYAGGGLRVGYWGSLAGGDYTAGSIKLTQTVGGSSSAEYTGPIAGDVGYFIDIDSALIGDVYVFSLKSNSGNGAMTYSGFTVDTIAVPEPSTYGLLLIGVGSLYFLRRKKAS